MRFLSGRMGALAALLACIGLPGAAFAGPPVPQGGQVTATVDVQLTVLPICKSVSFNTNQIKFSAVPSTQPVTTTFLVSYDCAANAFPTIAFLSQNGCNLLPDDKTNQNVVPYQILGTWGNQLACTPADLKNHFQPITSSPTSFTLKTGPLLQLDPHVYPAGTYGDKVTATLDF
jgi:hypothetical protein